MRLGWLIFSVASLALMFAVAWSGCNTTATSNVDASILTSGCRAPRACWKTYGDCECRRGSIADCLVCDPSKDPQGDKTFVCGCVPDMASTAVAATDGGLDMATPLDMTTTWACLEREQICVGRGGVCPGVGARCLPAGHGCGEGPLADEAAPQLVPAPAGGAPSLEPRCPYVDDVCCPGTVTPPDAATSDAAVLLDAATGD